MVRHARLVLDTDVTRGLSTLRATIADHTLPAALPDDRPGLVHLDAGAEEYGHRLWAFTSLDLTPEQVHRIGLDQVARLEAEYLQIAAPVLGTTSLAEIYERLRDDPALHYRDADTLVADATQALERATAATGPWFGNVPVAGCTANPTTHGAWRSTHPRRGRARRAVPSSSTSPTPPSRARPTRVR